MASRRLLSLTSCISSAVCVFVLAPSAVAAPGQTALIDFGNNESFRGVSTPAPDPNGNFWNSLIPGLFYTDLVDTTNTATTLDFGFSTPVGTDSFNGPAGPTSFPDPAPAEIAATDIDTAALGMLGVKEAAIDFAQSPGAADNRVRFEIQQLDPAGVYDLRFFGSHKFADAFETIYSVYTDNSYTTPLASTSLNVHTPGQPNLHNRDTVATLSGLSPQAGNILYVQFVGANNAIGYLNSLQVTQVPEPASFSTLAIGGLALLAHRRRRR